MDQGIPRMAFANASEAGHADFELCGSHESVYARPADTKQGGAKEELSE